MLRPTPRAPLTVVALVTGLCTLGRAQEPSPPASGEFKPRTLTPAPGMQVVDQGKGVSVTQRGRGKLLVVQDSWDFGYVPQDAHVSHRYLLQNSGDDTLFIEEVKPTCGCTVALLEKNRLAPGEKVPVEITLGTMKYSGVLTKKVHVISSDKDAPRYVLTFRAEVGAAPDIEWPSGRNLDLGRVAGAEHRTAKLPLVNRSGTARRVQIVEPPSAFLKASLSTAQWAPSSPFDLVVETAANPPVGAFKSSLTLELTGAQVSRLTIPITGVGVQN